MRDATHGESLRRFEDDGYVVFPDVVDTALLDEASDHIDWLLRRHPDLRGEQLDHRLVDDDPFWVRLVSDDRLLDIAELFVGPDIALFASHYISKPAFSGQPVLWHQDGSYWPLEPMAVVTLWLAIDDATPANGCMRVLPGSHRNVLHPYEASTEVDNVLSSRTTTDVDESNAVDVVLGRGDVEVHHPNLMHSSGPNRSPHRRAGLTIRYIPTSTNVVVPGVWPCHFLLRGQPGEGPYAQPPCFDPDRHFAFRSATEAC